MGTLKTLTGRFCEIKKFSGFPIRACIAMQIFFACFMVYLIRVTVSINILAMVKTGKKSKDSISECVEIVESANGTAPPLKDVSASAVGVQ